VFFDAFSPNKVPEMWTKEFFSDIYDKMKKNGKLSTYSCAKFVRDNLKQAGFIVKNGPVIGRRSPSTIAIK
jgi:tRNA U34 5-methylaminomethyl-2-thiouridine-forming methyltransferase MnmC